MNDIAVKCLPDATELGIRPMKSVSGVSSVQVTPMIVSIDGIEQEHLVVNPLPIKPDRAVCRSISEELQIDHPDAIISVVLDNVSGAADLFAPQDSVTCWTGIAAA